MSILHATARNMFAGMPAPPPGPGFSLMFGNGAAPTDDPNGYTWNVVTTRALWADYAANGDLAMLAHDGTDSGITASGQTLTEWGFVEGPQQDWSAETINNFPGSAIVGYCRNQSASSWSCLAFTGFPPNAVVTVEILHVSDTQGVRTDFGSGAASTPDINQDTSEGYITDGAATNGQIADINGLDTNGGTVTPTAGNGAYYSFEMTADKSGNCSFVVRGHGTSLAACIAAIRMTWDVTESFTPAWDPEVDDGTFDLTGLETTADPEDSDNHFTATGSGPSAANFDWLYSGTVRFRFGSGAAPYKIYTSNFTNGIDMTLGDYEFRIVRYPGTPAYGEEATDVVFSSWTTFAFGVSPEWDPNMRTVQLTNDNRLYFTVEIRDVATQTIRVRKHFALKCKRTG